MHQSSAQRNDHTITAQQQRPAEGSIEPKNATAVVRFKCIYIFKIYEKRASDCVRARFREFVICNQVDPVRDTLNATHTLTYVWTRLYMCAS